MRFLAGRLRLGKASAAAMTAGLLAVTALAGIATPAGAIEHGKAVDAPSWAAYIQLTVGDSASRCSGSLIGSADGDAVVLTAAHCIFHWGANAATNKREAVKIAPGDIEVWLGLQDPKTSWGYTPYEVSADTADPRYVYRSSWSPYDVAVLRLKVTYQQLVADKKLPVALAPRGYSVANGREATAYGYGCIQQTFDERGQPVGQCEASTTLNETQAGSYRVDYGCDREVTYCLKEPAPNGALPRDRSAVLPGDSGGPWVVTTSRPYVVALSSNISAPWNDKQRRWGGALAAWVTAPGVYAWLSGQATLHGGLVRAEGRHPQRLLRAAVRRGGGHELAGPKLCQPGGPQTPRRKSNSNKANQNHSLERTVAPPYPPAITAHWREIS